MALLHRRKCRLRLLREVVKLKPLRTVIKLKRVTRFLLRLTSLKRRVQVPREKVLAQKKAMARVSRQKRALFRARVLAEKRAVVGVKVLAEKRVMAAEWSKPRLWHDIWLRSMVSTCTNYRVPAQADALSATISRIILSNRKRLLLPHLLKHLRLRPQHRSCRYLPRHHSVCRLIRRLSHSRVCKPSLLVAWRSRSRPFRTFMSAARWI